MRMATVEELVKQYETDKKLQKEVADILGISQSYISRIEKKILLELKKNIVKETSIA